MKKLLQKKNKNIYKLIYSNNAVFPSLPPYSTYNSPKYKDDSHTLLDARIWIKQPLISEHTPTIQMHQIYYFIMPFKSLMSKNALVEWLRTHSYKSGKNEKQQQ